MTHGYRYLLHGNENAASLRLNLRHDDLGTRRGVMLNCFAASAMAPLSLARPRRPRVDCGVCDQAVREQAAAIWESEQIPPPVSKAYPN
jgi:hypothetical protein